MECDLLQRKWGWKCVIERKGDKDQQDTVQSMVSHAWGLWFKSGEVAHDAVALRAYSTTQQWLIPHEKYCAQV